MKILITGNLGYVGPGVVRRLRARHPHATLIGFDMGYFAHCLTLARSLPEAQLDLQYFGDVRRFPAQILEGIDAIVHLAAISNDPMGNAHSAVTLDVNFESGAQLAKMAKAAGVRSFVFASSCSVYGAADDEARTENSAVQPLTAYATSKVRLEEVLQGLSDESFRVTCLRFATACGMSDRLRLDLVLNDFVAAAVSSKEITVLSDGTPWRPLIEVQDMARAIEWAVERRFDQGGSALIVNAGSTVWNYRVQELAEAVAAVIPGTCVSINKAAPPDKRSYRVDFSLFRALAPDHVPQRTLQETIEDLRDGLQRMHFNDKEFRGSSFMRLKVLNELQSRDLLTSNLEWSHKQYLDVERGTGASNAKFTDVPVEYNLA